MDYQGKQRHRLRRMTGKKDVYRDGCLIAEAISGSQEIIDITVPDIRKQHKVECREHGRPYKTVKGTNGQKEESQEGTQAGQEGAEGVLASLPPECQLPLSEGDAPLKSNPLTEYTP